MDAAAIDAAIDFWHGIPEVKAIMDEYKLTCDDSLFLITTGGGGSSSGYAKWRYENEKLIHIMKVRKLAEIKECNANNE